jgi:hypothetical protein
MIALLFVACGLAFFLASFGLAWPLVARLPLTPAERLVLAPALSHLLLFLFGWAVFLTAAPPGWLGLAAPAGLLGLACGWRAARELWRDGTARELGVGYALVTAWCLGWLSLVVSYSGGGWAYDWFEHWQRMIYYLRGLPPGEHTIGPYAIAARPPLANVVAGTLLAPIDRSVPYYQLVTLLQSTLAFLPAALLARRFAPPPARATVPLLALAFMLSPFAVQNATFAWTKLPTAFLLLAALYWFLRARDAAAPRFPLTLAALLFAAALLTHYSAGPAIVVLGALWLGETWRRPDRAFRLRATALAAAAAALLLLPWFAWTAHRFGGTGLGTTTTATGAQASLGGQLGVTVLNLRDTLVPHFLRSPDPALIAQASTWGARRDFFFQTYQLNLCFAFGSVGWLALAALVRRHWRTAPRPEARFWAVFCGGTVLLGIAVHAPRDTWGLTHICLHALVLLGLAWLAGQWTALARPWRLALALGAGLDLLAGIGLHFAVQGFLVDRWFGGANWAHAARTHYSAIANGSLDFKHRSGIAFVADLVPFPGELVLALLAALLMLAVVRTRRAFLAPS